MALNLPIDTSSSAIRDVMRCLFFHGPTWDGNIPSKRARNKLCHLGLVTHRFGFAWLTDAGVEVAINAGLDREKDLRERHSRPSYLDD
jgi:hypothetical protein